MSGSIVLEDGHEYSAANWAADATIRAIAREVADARLREWLLQQQSTVVGVGMTCVDLREISPVQRAAIHGAIRAAYARVRAAGFERLDGHNEFTPGWLKLFGDLVEEVRRCEAREPPDGEAH